GHGEPRVFEYRSLEARCPDREVTMHALGAGELEIRLVQVRLDVGRELAAALEHALGVAAVHLRVALEDDGARAEALRLRERHAGPQAELARLVRARRDDAGADDHRLALQARVALLLDRGGGRVDVDVQHRARGGRLRRHARPPSRYVVKMSATTPFAMLVREAKNRWAATCPALSCSGSGSRTFANPASSCSRRLSACGVSPSVAGSATNRS